MSNAVSNTMGKRFGFLLFQDAEELDVVGPWEMISLWSKYFNGPKEVFTISQEGELISCAKGLRIASDYRFDNCPKLDFLLIPGGFGSRRETQNKELVKFIQAQAANCQHILSVCTGVFLLQAAGLLEGKKVTTHWLSMRRLRECTGLQIIEDRFVRDGNIWTAAGVSAGIDLAFALIAAIDGDEVAGKIQLLAEYYPLGKHYGSERIDTKLPAYLRNQPYPRIRRN